MIEVAGVLWDLDGTIVDTEPLWIAAEHELADAVGGVWTEEDALELVGNDLMDSGTYIRDRLGLSMTAREVVDFLIERVIAGLRRDVPWRPGALELMRAYAEAGVPQALVTMSWTSIADVVAAHLPLDAVITGDTVPRGKPHPDPYLIAAEKLGLDPAACVAVEDSRTGAASAVAAGCWVLAVPHMVRVPDAPRQVQVAGLDGLTPLSVAALFGR